MNEPDLYKGKLRHFLGKLWRYDKILISIILSLLLFFLALLLLVNLEPPTGDIRYQQTRLGISAIFQHDARRMHEFNLSQYEFEDAKTAITTFLDMGVTPQNFQEIVRFEENKYLMIFLPTYVSNPLLLRMPRIPIISSILFIERENGMLSPTNIWTQGIISLVEDTRSTWHDEDRVARDIVFAHIQAPISSKVNGGTPIFYGTGSGNPPTYISILGQQPDNIIPFEFRGDQYFFWYYLSTPHFGEILAENIDISEPFMLGDIIELFDIRVYRD